MVELMDLPRENLAEILSKLPTKSIFACRCVCKTFLDITSDTHFLNLFHSSKPSTQNLIIQFRNFSKKPRKYINWIDTNLDIDAYTKPDVGSNVSKELKLCPLLIKLPKYISLVNSCNGLVYFAAKSSDRGLYSVLLNPIRECTIVPEVDELDKKTLSIWLGYSPSSRKYKVLRIYTSYNETKLGAQIFEFDSSSYDWRDIESKPTDSINWNNSFAFVKGLGFWLCQDNYRFGKEKVAPFIVFFDFDSEKFGKIDEPLCFDERRKRQRRLMSIGVDVDSDCVCMIDNTQGNADIWNLDVNLDEKYWNWTLKFSCLDGDKKPSLIDGATLKPLQVESNGNILMASNDRDLIYYDRTSKSFRWIKMKKSHFNVVAFVPSFVSLGDSLR